MEKKAPPEATQAILKTVENQIRSGNPPETRLTIKRLQDEGLDHQKAVRLVASLVSYEIFRDMKLGESFNTKRFVSNLNNLPALPWEQCPCLTNRSTRTLPPPATSSSTHSDFSSPPSAPQSAPPVNSIRQAPP